jgi:nitrogen fixation-related uncharacterized protein
MGPPNSPDVHIEYVQHRRRQWKVVGVLVGFAVLLGVLALFGVAYARQSDRVDELQSQNDSILSDHHAIGDKFAEQSKRFAEQSRKLEAAIRSSYGQGFLAGQAAVRLPVGLRSLARYAAAGVLVPRRIPESIGESAPRVTKDLDGYTIRWRRLAFFASRTEPLSDWTRQALEGLRRLQLGPYRVQRLTGPSGVIYAWRKDRATYAVIALPRYEAAVRALIVSAR